MADHVLGCDLSNWQNLTPQSARGLAAAGVQLVIVRASHENRALIDIALAQMQMVLDAGMRLHAYGWMYATEDAAVTAQRWRALYAGLPIGRFWIDAEETQHIRTPSDNVAWLHRALGLLGQQWPTGIYTGAWWWPQYMGNSTEFSHLPLWDANYTNVPELEPGRLYGGWTRRAIHQYTGHGSLAGISPLDLDAVDPALLGEDTVTDAQMAEVQRIAKDEILRNIQSAVAQIDQVLDYRRLSGPARTGLLQGRENLMAGARPAAQTLARGLQPGEGDG